MARRRAGVGKGKKGHQHIQEEELTLSHTHTHAYTHTHTHTHTAQSQFPSPSSTLQGTLYFQSPPPLVLVTAPWPLSASSSILYQPRGTVRASAAQQARPGGFRQSTHHFPQPSGLFQGWSVCPVKVMREEMFEEIERESFPALLRGSRGDMFLLPATHEGGSISS